MKVILKDVRLSFPDLFVAKSIEGGKLRFGATFIIVPGSENAKLLDAAQKTVAKEKWEGRAKAILEDLEKKDRTAYRKCEKMSSAGEVFTGFEDSHFVSAANQGRPVVRDRDKSLLSESDGRPYGGCYVNASLDVYTYDDKNFGKRVIAKLLAVQFARDGDSFGGGERESEDDFEDISDTGGSDDDTDF